MLLLTEPWHGGVDPAGVGFALAAAVCWAAYIVLTQKVGDEATGLRGLAVSMPVAGLVEGVEGFGDDFMLAQAAPVPLPVRVTDDVRRLGARAADALGPVRFEWAHDGDQAWVLQLHLATVAASATTISPGTPARWHRFDPAQGLDRLRDLIARVPAGEGVEFTGEVGVTSHAGDLLRRAAIPARLAGPDHGRDAGI